MVAPLVDLAEQVVDELEDGTWLEEFEAVRAWIPRTDEGQLETLRLTVRAAEETVKVLNRAPLLGIESTIEIAVQQRVPSFDPTDVDPLVELTNQVADFFVGRSPGDRSDVCLERSVTVYDFELLSENNQFQSLITLKFQGIRNRVP